MDLKKSVSEEEHESPFSMIFGEDMGFNKATFVASREDVEELYESISEIRKRMDDMMKGR